MRSRSRRLLATRFLVQQFNILAVMMLHPLMLSDLAFESNLVGALVEFLDLSMLKFSLFRG